MTTSHNANPYESSDATHATVASGGAAPRWPVMLVACAAIYYLLSALTLPIVNKLWFGELPLFGIVQLPKSFLKSIVHDALMFVMNGVGLSRGSFSPDYIATHGLAMVVMTTAPALLLIVVLKLFRRLPHRGRLIAVVFVCATIDAVVTLWFDAVSSLKLYNASYF
jgi:hypothetical protein